MKKHNELVDSEAVLKEYDLREEVEKELPIIRCEACGELTLYDKYCKECAHKQVALSDKGKNRVVLNREMVESIRRIHAMKRHPLTRIAVLFDTTPSNIGMVVRHRTWRSRSRQGRRNMV